MTTALSRLLQVFRTALQRASRGDGHSRIVAALLVAVPLALNLDLARIPGLFEFGDANFPVLPFPRSTFLPWDEHFDLGFDNVFTSVPRASYLILINVILTLFKAPSIAQYALYVAISTLGVTGMYRMARALGSARLPALLVASVFMFNPWTAARIGQTPLILAFAGTPWLFWSVHRIVYRPALRAFAVALLSAVVVLSSLQIAYLDALGLAAVVLPWTADVAVRKKGLGAAVARLSLALALSVLACAFFIFPAAADALHGSGGSVQNVTSRFGYNLFSSYGAYEDFANAARLVGFYYSPLRTAPSPWVQSLWLFPCLTAVAAAKLRSTKGITRATITGCGTVVILALFFVVGSHRFANLVSPLWSSIPGMRGLIDPDYIVELLVLGAAMILACGPRHVAFRLALYACALILAVPFFPGNGLYQKTLVPAAYQDLPRYLEKDRGRLIWMPDRWVSRYTWSPYILSGVASLWTNEHPAFGPTTVEITPTGSSSIEQAMLDAFEQKRSDDFLWFASKTRTRFALVAHDIVDDQLARYDPASGTTLEHAASAFAERRALLQYGDTRLDAKTPTAFLAPGLSWQIRYKTTGALRDGQLHVDARSVKLRDLARQALHIDNPGTVALTPLAHETLIVQLNSNRTGTSIIVRREITVEPGSTVLTIAVPAKVQLLAKLRSASGALAFVPMKDGKLQVTIRAFKREAAYLSINAINWGRGSALTIEKTRWPAGSVTITQVFGPHKSISVVTSPYFSLFRVPRQLKPPLSVASHPIIANSDVAVLPSIGRLNHEGDVIAPAGDAGLEAWALHAPISQTAQLPSGDWDLRYISPTLDLRGSALLDGRRFTLSSLHTGRKIHLSGKAAILPIAEYHDVFSKKRWTTGDCSGAFRGPGSSIVVTHGMLEGLSQRDVLCASARFVFHRGHSDIRVHLGRLGMAARGLIAVGDNAFPLAVSASGKDLVGAIDAPNEEVSRIYLYVDPGVGNIQYRDITIRTWPEGTLVIQGTTRMRFADNPIQVTRIGLLSARILIPPRDRPEIVIGWWSYSKGWEGWLSGASAIHTIADGYANAWIIPPSKRESVLELRYASTHPYVAGLIISILIGLGCVGILILGIVPPQLLMMLHINDGKGQIARDP